MWSGFPCRQDIYESAFPRVYYPQPLQGTPPILADKSSPVFYEITSFFFLVCKRPLCVPSRSRFLCFSVLWNFNETPLAFKDRFSRGSSSYCQDPPQAGEPDVRFRTSWLWENVCGIIIFQFVHSLCSVYGIWFLSWLYCSYHFIVTSSLSLKVPPFFVNDCLAVSCDFNVSIRIGKLMLLHHFVSKPCWCLTIGVFDLAIAW